jgi:hypothetical protein
MGDSRRLAGQVAAGEPLMVDGGQHRGRTWATGRRGYLDHARPIPGAGSEDSDIRTGGPT